ncbi:aromatic prenyltransferase [Whalleya microplaca]|nr:aromatic prenyltransferase [Whalleya microplaca]
MDVSSTTICQPWQSLARGLGFANEHENYWWSKIAPLAGKLMNWAQYSTPEQYRILAFIYKYLLPTCGPKPNDDGGLFWKVLVSYDYTPVQLSLSFHKGKMTFRTGNVPISEISGTVEDPINQQASVDAMIRQQQVLKSQDLHWFDHFASKLFFDRDTAASLKPKIDEVRIQQAVQCVLGYDFLESDVQCKVAFNPFWKSIATGLSLKEIMWDTIMDLGDDIVPYKPSLAILEQYLSSENAAKTGISPAFFAFDSVLKDNHKSSRIKIYCATMRTAFNTMVDIYTLGGLLVGPDIEKGLEALRVLWKAVLKVPQGWPDDRDLPVNPHLCAVVPWNFEVRPGTEFPAPQIYLPAHYYGRPDLEIADGIDRFFKCQGLDELYPSYKESYLKCFMNSENQLTALHHDISFSFKGSSVYVTAYFKPELHLNIE